MKVVGFPASAHAQGQGTPPPHSDWPKVGGKSRMGGGCLASVGLACSRDARQRCTE